MQHTRINGISTEHLPVMDRGLQYGDGLFETVACVEGKLQFWDEHIERMCVAAKRLNIEFSSIENFEHDVLSMLQDHNISNAVVKLILTRGQSERGYRSPLSQRVTRIVVLNDLPKFPDAYISQGIKLCFCQCPVSTNSRLAGIKHLNRLDNVLARNEWQDEYQEGIMLDDSGYAIEGTMSNIFAVKNDQLYTPSLETSGVDGVIRGQILLIAQELAIEVNVVKINKKELENMDEIFVCNSIIGIWPVRSLNENKYNVGALTQNLYQVLQKRIRV